MKRLIFLCVFAGLFVFFSQRAIALSGPGWSCGNNGDCTRLFSCHLSNIPLSVWMEQNLSDHKYGSRLRQMLAITATPTETLKSSFKASPFELDEASWPEVYVFEPNLLSGPTNPPPLSCQNKKLKDHALFALIEKDDDLENLRGYKITIKDVSNIGIETSLEIKPADASVKNFVLDGGGVIIQPASTQNNDFCAITVDSPGRVILKNLSIELFATGICVKSGQIILDNVSLRYNDIAVSLAGGNAMGANVIHNSILSNNNNAAIHLADKSPLVIIDSGIYSSNTTFTHSSGQLSRFLVASLYDGANRGPRANQLGHLIPEGKNGWIGLPFPISFTKVFYSRWKKGSTSLDVPVYFAEIDKTGDIPKEASFQLAVYNSDSIGGMKSLRQGKLIKYPAKDYYSVNFNILGMIEDPDMLTGLGVGKTYSAVLNYMPDNDEVWLPYKMVKVIDKPNALSSLDDPRTIAILPIQYEEVSGAAIIPSWLPTMSFPPESSEKTQQGRPPSAKPDVADDFKSAHDPAKKAPVRQGR